MNKNEYIELHRLLAKLNYEIAMKNEYIEYVKTKKQDVIYNNEQK